MVNPIYHVNSNIVVLQQKNYRGEINKDGPENYPGNSVQKKRIFSSGTRMRNDTCDWARPWVVWCIHASALRDRRRHCTADVGVNNFSMGNVQFWGLGKQSGGNSRSKPGSRSPHREHMLRIASRSPGDPPTAARYAAQCSQSCPFIIALLDRSRTTCRNQMKNIR